MLASVAGLALVAAGVALLAVSSHSLAPIRSALLDLPCTCPVACTSRSLFSVPVCSLLTAGC